MDTYGFLRELADSWGLLVMFVFFLGVIVWALLPSNNARHEDAANVPFRHEDRPAPDHGAPSET